MLTALLRNRLFVRVFCTRKHLIRGINKGNIIQPRFAINSRSEDKPQLLEITNQIELEISNQRENRSYEIAQLPQNNIIIRVKISNPSISPEISYKIIDATAEIKDTQTQVCEVVNQSQDGTNTQNVLAHINTPVKQLELQIRIKLAIQNNNQ